MGYFVKNRLVGRKPDGSAIPVGDSNDRPSDPVVGSLRYNTDIDTYEYWNGITFVSVGIQGEVDLVVDSFAGNNAQVSFTMTYNALTAQKVLVFVGGVYQIPIVNYDVSGNTITFSTAPPVDTIINVIHKLGSTVITDEVDQPVIGPTQNPDGGIYDPPGLNLVPGEEIVGGTYDPIDTSPAGPAFDGGTY